MGERDNSIMTYVISDLHGYPVKCFEVDRHNAVKSMERDITDLRHYRKQIIEIASICDDTVSRIDALIETIDKYRK